MSSMVPKHQTRIRDRISALPDELICHILSSLRTVEVLQTMVLSKRWKNIWVSVPSLDFDYKRDIHKRDFGRDDGLQDFQMVVSRVLDLRDSSDIPKLRLVISSIPKVQAFDDWIYIAVRRNVVEIDLHMVNDNNANTGFELPRWIFMCKTLRVLRLNLGRLVGTEPPTSGSCFPSLKLLHLTVFNPYRTTMQDLLSSCPVLEDLTIDGTIDVIFTAVRDHLKIFAPELKRLRINLEINRHPMYVYIDSPKLENIDLKMVGLTNFSLMGSAKSLVNANIVFREWSDHELDAKRQQVVSKCAVVLLDQVSNVKSLSLSAHCLENWHLPKDWHPPEFRNVNQLRLTVGDCSCWELLPGFLKNSPNLEDFVFEDRTEGCEELSELHWSPPEDMPLCFFSHLKTISLKGFKGWQVEMEMVKFLLNNGHLLKKMTIATYPCLSYSKQEELYKEFMMFHKATACHIEFMHADASLDSTR